MTTDTRRKETVVRGDGFVVGGMAKGAAMLAPNMATMLAVLTTDAAVEPAALRRPAAGVADSFNAMTVDGCTSTNDTVHPAGDGRAGRPDPAPSTPPSPTRASTWPRRWWATPRATPRSSQCGSPAPPATTRPAARPQGGREPAREVLVVRRGPVLGPGGQRARHRRRRLDVSARHGRLRRDGRRRGRVASTTTPPALAAHMAGATRP